ncbi:MAG: PDZ domain-containing protein [Bacteroidales bacterium]|nr:PDZ domain-containing protein [Bacteroidales bacterium]
MMKRFSYRLPLPLSLCFCVLIFSLFLLYSCQSNQQNQAEEKATSWIEIPQDFRYGWLTLPLEVNGNKAIQVILDLSTPFDGLVLFHKETVNELGLALPEGGSGKLADSVMLSIGNVDIGQAGLVTFGEDRQTSVFEVAGIIGKTVFEKFLVELDFDCSLIKLHQPGSLIPGEDWLENRLTEDRGNVYADFVVGLNGIDAHQVECAIDMSGFSYYLRLKEGSGPGMDIPPHAVRAFLGDGITGDRSGHIFRAYTFRTGNYVLDGLITEMVGSDTELPFARNGSIGLKLLRRFNMMIDYSNLKLYLKSNKSINDPFLYNMTGFNTRLNKDKSWQVVQIFDDSPAGEAGIRLGDIILKINGRERSDYTFAELEALTQKRGDTLTVTVRSNGQETEKKLILRELF